MRPEFIGSSTPIELRGTAVPGAEDRQGKIPGFDQQTLSLAEAVCIGAGGIMSMIAPTLARKGIGGITLLDDDLVEVSNLNRQRFYPRDLGKFKAIALAENLQSECIVQTRIRGIPTRFEEAIASGVDLGCDLAICGVDNNPARVAAAHHFRSKQIPVIFAGVSVNGDHGYVFVQDRRGSCIGCLFPDIANDDRYPCPGTPAIADILQAVGAFAVYAADTILTERVRTWNYRRISLADGSLDGASVIPARHGCSICKG